jgi:hypothetical protein
MTIQYDQLKPGDIISVTTKYIVVANNERTEMLTVEEESTHIRYPMVYSYFKAQERKQRITVERQQ